MYHRNDEPIYYILTLESLLLISSKDLSKHSDIVTNTNILKNSKDENKGSPFTI